MKTSRIRIRKKWIYAILALISLFLTVLIVTGCSEESLTVAKDGSVIHVYSKDGTTQMCTIALEADIVDFAGSYTKSSALLPSQGSKVPTEIHLPTKDEKGYIENYVIWHNGKKTVITGEDCVLKGIELAEEYISIVDGQFRISLSPQYYTKFSCSDHEVYLDGYNDSGIKTKRIRQGVQLVLSVTEKPYYDFVEYSFSKGGVEVKSDTEGVFDFAWDESLCDVEVTAIYTPKIYDFFLDYGDNKLIETGYSLSYTSRFYLGNENTQDSFLVCLKSKKLNIIPQKEGFDFTGWYSHRQTGSAQEGKRIIDENGNLLPSGTTFDAENYVVTANGVVLHAGWKRHEYTLEFKTKEGDTSSKIAVFGEPFDMPKAPEITGYTFVGWKVTNLDVICDSKIKENLKNATITGPLANVEIDGKSILANGMFALNSNRVGLSFTAQWEANTNTIYYNPNGGKGQMSETSILTDTKKELSDNVFERKGYTFLGWHTDKDAADGKYKIQNGKKPEFNGNFFSQNSESSVTLYAIWSVNVYDVKYTIGDMTNELQQYIINTKGYTPQERPESFTIEESLSLPNVNLFLHTFDGWYMENDKEFKTKITELGKNLIDSANEIHLVAKFSPIDYDIIYNIGDLKTESFNVGAVDETKVKTYNNDFAILLNSYERVGYEFKGWYVNDDYSDDTNFGFIKKYDGEHYLSLYKLDSKKPISTKRINVYAKWETIKYTISYEGIDGINDIVLPTEYNVEQQITLPAITKYGHTFTGWTYLVADIPTNISEIKKSSTGDITFTANFTVDVFEVDYRCNGGTLKDGEGTSYKITEVVGDYVNLLTAEKSGYTFGGWYKDAQCVNPVLMENEKYRLNVREVSDSANSIENVVLYAKWNRLDYDINYSGIEGVEQIPEKTTYNVEEQYTLPIMKKFGYSFIGWKNGEDIITEINKGTTGDISLVASFDIISFTLIAECDGGVVEATFQQSFTISDFFNIDGIVNDGIELSSATKRGYSFDGWYLKQDYSGGLVEQNLLTLTMLQGNVDQTTSSLTLYAKWQVISYTISYENLNDNEKDGLIKSYTVEDEVVLAATSRLGYSFDRWTKDGNPIQTIKNSIDDVTLSAVFTPITYHLNYNLDGGQLPISAIKSYNFDQEEIRNKYYKIELPIPTKTGYSFLGWCTDQGLTNILNNRLLNAKAMASNPSHIVSVYASWRPITYSITYNNVDDNASLSSTLVTEYTIESEDIILPIIAATGDKTFFGWFSEGDLENAVTVIKSGSVGNMVLTAKYNANNYQFHYNLNGGVNDDENPNDFTGDNANADNYIVLKDATKEGYAFNGWWMRKEVGSGELIKLLDGNKFDFEIVDALILNYELFAKWVPVQYSITYNNIDGIDQWQPITSYTTEQELTLPKVTKFGYDFLRWEQRPEGASAIATPRIAKGSIGDLSLYAVFRYSVFTLQYELNGGVNAENAITTYTIEQGDGKPVVNGEIEIAAPTKNGYAFEGWFYDAEYKTRLEDNKFDTTLFKQATSTIYAKWSQPINYTITYLNVDGIREILPKTTYNVTEEYSLPRISKYGYVFVDWMQQGLPITSIYLGTTGNLELTAEFDYFNFALSYELYGGTMPEGAVSSFTVNDFSAEKLEIAVPTRNGYNFEGWYYNGAYDRKLEQNKLTLSSNFGNVVTIFAKWSQPISYSIDYNVSEQDVIDFGLKTTYNIEESFVLKEVSKIGYRFVSWKRADGKPVSEVSVGTYGDMNLVAEFLMVDYSINLIKNGGTVEAGLQSSFNVESYPMGGVPIPVASKDCYQFDNWYLDAEFEQPILNNKYLLTENSPSSGMVQLYAKFIPIVYLISYQNIGGINEENLPSSFTIEDSFELPNVTKFGYVFKGWKNKTEIEQLGYVTAITQRNKGDLTIAAEFDEAMMEIRYSFAGIDSSKPMTVYDLSDLDHSGKLLLSGATASGYTFVGWYYDSDYNLPVEKQGEYNLFDPYQIRTHNSVLYAKWSKNSYKVTIIENNSKVTVVDENTGLTINNGDKVPFDSVLRVTYVNNKGYMNTICKMDNAIVYNNSMVMIPAHNTTIICDATIVRSRISIDSRLCDVLVTRVDNSALVSDGEYVDYNTRLRITYTAKNGYKEPWCKNNGINIVSGTEIYMPETGITISAGATIELYKVSILCNDYSVITVTDMTTNAKINNGDYVTYNTLLRIEFNSTSAWHTVWCKANNYNEIQMSTISNSGTLVYMTSYEFKIEAGTDYGSHVYVPAIAHIPLGGGEMQLC